MIDKSLFSSEIERVRKNTPLIHNITNYVAMNFTANALLSFGASPVMAHAVQEVADMVKISSASVINIGTLDEQWIEGMKAAAQAANDYHKPWVLDPVGVGATPYRTETALLLIHNYHPTIIRGNASEIMALTDRTIKSKGVDSTAKVSEAVSSAQKLAQETKSTVVISGEIDYITDGERTECIKNGSPIMPLITAMGCTASSLVGTFAGVCEDPLLASTYAMAVMGIAGDITAEKCSTPGTFLPLFIDTLYTTTAQEFAARIKQ